MQKQKQQMNSSFMYVTFINLQMRSSVGKVSSLSSGAVEEDTSH